LGSSHPVHRLFQLGAGGGERDQQRTVGLRRLVRVLLREAAPRELAEKRVAANSTRDGRRVHEALDADHRDRT